MRGIGNQRIDWSLFGLGAALLLVSVAMIYSLTAGRVTGSLATNQSVFGFVGLGLAFALSKFDYRHLRSFSLPLFGAGLLLLLAVLLFGTTIFGATRWIDLLGFQFQPSELMKLLAVIFSAYVLSIASGQETSPGLIAGLLGAVGLATGLILKQPDLGTAAILLAVLFLMLIAARLPKSYWFLFAGLAALGAPMLYLNLKGYQLERLETFLRPTADPLGAGYNVLQSIIAVGNGGLFGAGLGQGTQSQLDFLPVVHTDFIFAGIAESVGFIGSMVLIVMLVVLLLRAVQIALGARDRFGMLLSFGISGLWFIQIVVNIGMNLGLAPVTGIPLPFISYGGTALIVNLAALGLIGSVASRSGHRLSSVGS